MGYAAQDLELIRQWSGRFQGSWARYFWIRLFHGILWGIWKERNQRIFKEKKEG